MPGMRATIDIDAPAEKVWEVISDFGNIYKWNPGVSKSILTSDSKSGEGTTRHCDLAVPGSPGSTVEERIIDWKDGASYTVEMYQTKRIPFMKDLEATVSVEPTAAGSIGGFEFGYETTVGPIGRMMDRLVIASRNRKVAALLVAGLKHYVETGEEVGKGVRVDTTGASVIEH